MTKAKGKRKARQTIPFIFGAFLRPESLREKAQEYYLVVVQDKTPGPLYSLRRDLFPQFCSAFECGRSQGEDDAAIHSIAFQALIDAVHGQRIEHCKASKTYSELSEAAGALLLWAEQFNLLGTGPMISAPELTSLKSVRQTAIWPLVAALETLIEWHFGPAPWLRRNSNPPLWRAPVHVFKGPPGHPELLPAITLRGPLCQFPRPHTADEADLSVGMQQAGWNPEFESEESFRLRAQYLYNRKRLVNRSS